MSSGRGDDDGAPFTPDADPRNREWLRKTGRETRYVVRRFDGDDRYSWAVFRRRNLPADVRSGGINARLVFYGEAEPVESGLSKREARAERERLNGELDRG